MVCAAGAFVIAGHSRRGPRTGAASRLYALEPEPRARAGRRVQPSQPAAFPRQERRGLCLARRRGARARSRQPNPGGAPRAALGAMAALRCGAAGADARPARPHPRHPGPQPQHLRDGVEEPGLGPVIPAAVAATKPTERPSRMDISGKTAIVTGAASGIGLGIATALAEAGANVVMADIQKAAVEAAAHCLSGTNKRVMPLRIDVTQEQSF